MLTIANLSGGRDSTAMVIRYLELGNNIDYILFVLSIIFCSKTNAYHILQL